MTSSNYEIKNTSFELKEISEEGMITGYGSVFGNTDNGNDVVMKGAFNRTINTGKNVKMLWQHKRDEPIGVWTDIKADDHGLIMTGQLALETQKGRETLALLKMGALDGLSIGFIPVKADYNDKGEREIKEVNLKEVSVVTFPMNESATVLAVKEDIPELNVEQIKEVSQFIRSIVDKPAEKEEIKEETEELQHISDDIASIISDTKESDLSTMINSIVNKN